MLHIIPSRIDRNKDYRYLNQFQFDTQVEKCLQCHQKPCSDGCPCHCDPCNFIRAAKGGRKSDIDLAALIMYSKTPFSSTCGTICTADFCMRKCTRQRLDMAINIPAVQAEIAKRAHANGRFLQLIKHEKTTGKTVAVVGAGPAGLACASSLASRGHKIVIFERKEKAGGDVNYIPQFRMNQQTIEMDVNFCKACGDVEIKYGTDFKEEMAKDYDAVCWCVGQQIDNNTDVSGNENSIAGRKFLLLKPEEIKDKNIAIVGCGAVAIDCAVLASKYGAQTVQIFYRRTINEAPLTPDERGHLSMFGVSVVQRTVLKSIEKNGENLTIHTIQVGKDLNIIEGTEQLWKNIDFIVNAIGQKSEIDHTKVQFSAGTANGKSMSAVQAAASGKNAALKIDAFLKGKEIPEIQNDLISDCNVFEINWTPADISVNIAGLKIPTPIIAAASPMTNNLNSAQHLLELGWGGVVIDVAPSNSNRHVTNYHKDQCGFNFYGEKTANDVKEIIDSLSKQFSNRALIASLDALSSSFENDLKIILSSAATAIQIRNYPSGKCVDANIPVFYTTQNESKENMNNFAIVDLRRYLNDSVSIVDESRHLISIKKDHLSKGFAVCGGCHDDKDVLQYLRQGAQFVEVDPSSIDSNGNGIGMLNALLSHFIYSENCENLEQYLKNSLDGKTTPIDVEDLGDERLICKLTNPYACLGCGRCEVCPTQAIELVPSKWKYDVDPQKCVGCGLCVSKCPSAAISLVKRNGNESNASH